MNNKEIKELLLGVIMKMYNIKLPRITMNGDINKEIYKRKIKESIIMLFLEINNIIIFNIKIFEKMREKYLKRSNNLQKLNRINDWKIITYKYSKNELINKIILSKLVIKLLELLLSGIKYRSNIKKNKYYKSMKKLNSIIISKPVIKENLNKVEILFYYYLPNYKSYRLYNRIMTYIYKKRLNLNVKKILKNKIKLHRDFINKVKNIESNLIVNIFNSILNIRNNNKFNKFIYFNKNIGLLLNTNNNINIFNRKKLLLNLKSKLNLLLKTRLINKNYSNKISNYYLSKINTYFKLNKIHNKILNNNINNINKLYNNNINISSLNNNNNIYDNNKIINNILIINTINNILNNNKFNYLNNNIINNISGLNQVKKLNNIRNYSTINNNNELFNIKNIIKNTNKNLVNTNTSHILENNLILRNKDILSLNENNMNIFKNNDKGVLNNMIWTIDKLFNNLNSKNYNSNNNNNTIISTIKLNEILSKLYNKEVEIIPIHLKYEFNNSEILGKLTKKAIPKKLKKLTRRFRFKLNRRIILLNDLIVHDNYYYNNSYNNNLLLQNNLNNITNNISNLYNNIDNIENIDNNSIISSYNDIKDYLNNKDNNTLLNNLTHKNIVGWSLLLKGKLGSRKGKNRSAKLLVMKGSFKKIVNEKSLINNTLKLNYINNAKLSSNLFKHTNNGKIGLNVSLNII